MSYWNNGKFCHSAKDIPGAEHWAIVYSETTWIPGDERSKTNPGHGYPEHDERKVVYVAFMDRADWERQVVELEKPGNREFKAIHVQPAQIHHSVVVVG
jgi:hypothetical protein